MTLSPPTTPATAKRTTFLLHASLTFSLGLAILTAIAHDYRLVQRYDFLRTDCLLAGIIAGCATAFCFGGTLHYVHAFLTTAGLPVAWYVKLLCFLLNRLLLLLQLAAMAVVVLALGALLFGWEIPHPDWSLFYEIPRQPDFPLQ